MSSRRRRRVVSRSCALACVLFAWPLEGEASPGDIVLTNELSVGPLRPGRPHHLQEHVRVVATPQGYLVTWQDARVTDRLLYGARVDPSGRVLDAVGFPISMRPTIGGPAAIAFDGIQQLLAFRSMVDGGVRAIRVSGGKALDADELVLSTGSGTSRVDVAFDGANHLVTWPTSEGIVGVRVDPAGVVLDQPPTTLVARAGADLALEPLGVACGAGVCLVVWRDLESGKVEGVRAVSGSTIDAVPIAIAMEATASAPEGVKVAFDGTDFVVAYSVVAEGGPRTRVQRVTASGAVESTAIDLAGACSALEASGSAYMIASGSQLAKVTKSGAPLGAPLALEGRSPAGLACRADGCIYAWGDDRDLPADTADAHPVVWARSLTAGNAWSAPAFRLVSNGDAQRLGSFASRGTEGLLVWWQQLGTSAPVGATGAVFAARIGAKGALFDPLGVRVSAIIEPRSLTTGAPNPTGDYVARVATDGAEYLVVWPRPSPSDAKNTVLYGARLAANATLLDASPFEVLGAEPPPPPGSPPEPGRALVAFFDGAAFVVVWGARVVRVAREGGVIAGSARTLATPPEDIATNGKVHLVVSRKGTDLFAARFDGQFMPLDPAPFPLSIAAGEQRAPSVATNGTDFFVAWDDSRNAEPGKSTTDLYGARVTEAGKVLDPLGIPLVVDPNAQRRSNRRPAVAFSQVARTYFLAWERGVADGGGRIADARSELKGVALDEEGQVRAPGAFSIMATPYHPWSRPVVRALEGSRLLVAYERLDMQAPYGSRRTHARVVDVDPPQIIPSPNGGEAKSPDATTLPESDRDARANAAARDACGCHAAGATRSSTGAGAAFLLGALAVLGRRRSRHEA